ncbi:hypothetical protein XBO1_1040003 [Xenorhabdus bovienii str. oregonense]|uniref:Uncharacterized protein n=1 Tax=Xenorhabdus bovienii str. oregonense TaxID=1398202 RepID=A0A077NZ97_XENBV|nr:hypothetical protein XBO1_1040003 [Xenorhabdus bovienii str. oregonense]
MRSYLEQAQRLVNKADKVPTKIVIRSKLFADLFLLTLKHPYSL